MQQSWHSRTIEDTVRQLETDRDRGLPAADVQGRLTRYGPNELVERAKRGLASMFVDQFREVLVLILVVAAVISGFLGQWVDAGAICAIVVLNAVLGVVQERKAERSLEALKKLAAPVAQVVRDGQVVSIPTRELVPGDVLLLQTGDRIPADVRLAESVNLMVDQAALTGESVPVEKDAAEVVPEDAAVGDRSCSAFAGTVVTYGRGRGLVVATGMRTEVGRIAEMLQSVETQQTPLQMKLNRLGKWLSAICIALCAVVFAAGIAHGEPFVEMFMTAVSLAVAAIPEGLPAIVTIVLALGVSRMVARHAIIKKLPAVETLGCATVICSDKTGTLTQNKMQVTQVYADGRTLSVTGTGNEPEGEFQDESGASTRIGEGLDRLLSIGVLCNDASLQRSDDGDWQVAGDPTEGALQVVGEKAGKRRRDLANACPRVAEIPFDSKRKRMTTVHRNGDDGYIAYVKGAPDALLERCGAIHRDGGAHALSAEDREEILTHNRGMAGAALRVLGAAYRVLDEIPDDVTVDTVETDLVFVGLWGMIDAARPEARQAVEVCRKAGIRPVMITGDFRLTAHAIAQELGMASPDAGTLTGADLDELSDEALEEAVGKTTVYARVSPKHKMRIVAALQKQGHVVAMTGDGVNDAPALKASDIGVAMGISGTDVAKETADMVLTDDNFASIVGAVEEGRAIFDNIRKFTLYLLSCNLGEILIVFVPIIGGLGRPLEPIQILWINLLTDGLPALALGMEPPEKGTMDRPPRDPKEGVFTRETTLGTVTVGCLVAAATLGAYLTARHVWPAEAQTVAFATLTLSELWRAFSNRSNTYTILQLGILTNRYLIWAVAASIALLAVVMFIPAMHPVFKTGFLSTEQWAAVFGFSLLPAVLIEIGKAVGQWVPRRR